MSSFEYYNTLTGDIKWRYDQKIQICNNIDPYKLAPGDCTLSICDIPNVTIVDLMNYLVLSHSFYTGQQFKSMKSLQAYKFAESGAVLSILAKKVNEEAFVVVCKVRHSQRFREKPLDTWVILLKDGSVSSAHCSCMAGLGEACSHIATVLFYLHFRPGTTDQSRLACTEVLSAWPVPPVKSGSMVPVSEMVWSQQEKPVTSKELNCSMDAQETESFLRKLIDAGISPAICRLMDPFASEMEKKEVVDLPDTYDSWYNANLKNKTYEDLLEMCKRMYISVTEKHIENIEFHTKDQSQSSIWFKYRAGRITASKFKSVCRTSIEKPSLTVIKGVCYPQKVIFYSKQTSYGEKHEKTALEKYQLVSKENHQNLLVKPSGFVISVQHTDLGASPDALVSCDCCGQGCVEIKCPYLFKSHCLTLEQFASKKNSCLIREGQNIILDKKHAYFFQVQLQMFVTKTVYCDFVVWSKDQIFIERIFFDSSFCSVNIDKALNFHNFVIKPELLARYFTEQGGSARVVLLCHCKKPDDGRPMLRCDNDNCDIEWFHFECVNLTEIPFENWFCSACKL